MNELLNNRKIIKFIGSIEEDKPNYPPELMRVRRKKFTHKVKSLCAGKQNDNKYDRHQTIAYGDTYRFTITKT